MCRKSLILLSTFFATLILFSTIVFANTSNDIKNGINDASTTMVDGAEKLGTDVKNGINNAGSDMVNGAEHLGDDIRNGVGNAENGIEGALNMDDMKTTNYVATRTTGDSSGTNNSMNINNPTTWVWVIVAIAGVVIVGMVWYYATQNTTTNNRHDDDE